MSVIDEIENFVKVTPGPKYKNRLFSLTDPNGVAVPDALEKLIFYAKAASANLEAFPRFFNCILLSMISMRIIGARDYSNLTDLEYDNLAIMSFTMLEDAALSESSNMQDAVTYMQQFIR